VGRQEKVKEQENVNEQQGGARRGKS